LLLQYLEANPSVSKILQARKDNDLRYGLQYLKARNNLMRNVCSQKEAYRDIAYKVREGNSHFLGSWDDHVERLEFYGQGTRVHLFGI
jgi:hypothetical protein